MSFDIEKMKADGVDPKIIDFVQLSEDELYNKIARRLENDSIFRDFMTKNGDMVPYAVAAGLITEAERKWLADENNPYLEDDRVTITFKDEEGNLLAGFYYEDQDSHIDYANPLKVEPETQIRLPNYVTGMDDHVYNYWTINETEHAFGGYLTVNENTEIIYKYSDTEQEI